MARRLPRDCVALVCWQLGEALRAGFDKADAVQAVRQNSSASAKCPELVDAMACALQGKSSWPQALARFPDEFPPEAAALLEHGEGRNQLPEAMEMLSRDFEEQASLRASLRGAFSWPMFIGVFLLLVSTVLMIFVIPGFKDAFATFGADLPGPTMLVIAVSDFAVQYWWLAVLAVLSFVLAWQRPSFRAVVWRRVNPWLQRLPVLGPYLNTAFLVRAGQVFVPVVEGRFAAATVAAYLRATVGKTAVAPQASALETRLAQGASLSEAMRATFARGGDLALAIELDARRAGESRATRRALETAAEDLARQRVRLEQLAVGSTYVVTGLVVGIFVISMYLPIFKLGSVI